MTRFCDMFAGPTVRNPIWALCGVLIGASLMLSVATYTRDVEVRAAVDKLKKAEAASRGPVAVVSSTVRSFDSDGVDIFLGPAEKLRDCAYHTTQAFFLADSGGVMRDLNGVRIDTPEPTTTRPLGRFASFGLWRLSPRITEKGRLLMFVNYDCGDIVVVNRVADVENPQ